MAGGGKGQRGGNLGVMGVGNLQGLGEEGAGAGRNRTKSCNIVQHFTIGILK